MTWKELKLATLQKMFSADGSSIPQDDSTKDYIAAMPYAANEGILMMATAGKFLVKSISISVNPIPNVLGSIVGGHIHNKVKGELTYKYDDVHSYYFEVTGKCTCSIFIEDSQLPVETIDIDSIGKYTDYRNIIPNIENKAVTIVFNSAYPYTIKNIALYQAVFDYAEDIPAYAERIRYTMTDLVDDFHTINSIYFEGDANTSRYIKTDDVFQEGDKVLALDSDTIGNYIVYYNALPTELSTVTDDDYVLPLDREVAALLPLYMASQLYKDDDIAIATQYRNEFEVGFERLQASIPNGKAEAITIESGWI